MAKGAIALCALATLPALAGAEQETAYLRAAVAAGEWIRSHQIETNAGLTWPMDPEDTRGLGATLYSGSPGVVLFFAELGRVTGDAAWLDDAKRGADELIASIPTAEEPRAGETGDVGEVGGTGLYVGLGGVGFTLDQMDRHTGDARYREAAHRCVDLLIEGSRGAGAGRALSGVTDIVSGDAGAGLFLLYAANEMDHDGALGLARDIGDRLVEVALPTKGGLRWMMSPGQARYMPNFSHGTAGVAYFLARLHRATGEGAYLDAAVAGAEELLSIGDAPGGALLVYHHPGDGAGLHYLGWCHGPVGTTRLFASLADVTGEARWRELVARGARGVSMHDVHEKRTPGFWNNVGVCCGSAGVAAFYLDMRDQADADAFLALARKMGDDILSRATREGEGFKWSQAEHRVRPEFLVAQTGYMQGASGIGLTLLRIDAAVRGEAWPLRLPDDPY